MLNCSQLISIFLSTEMKISHLLISWMGEQSKSKSHFSVFRGERRVMCVSPELRRRKRVSTAVSGKICAYWFQVLIYLKM